MSQKPRRRKIFVENINIPEIAVSAENGLSEVSDPLKAIPVNPDKKTENKLETTATTDENEGGDVVENGSIEEKSTLHGTNVWPKTESKKFETTEKIKEVIQHRPSVESLLEVEPPVERAKEAEQKSMHYIKKSAEKPKTSFELKSNTLYEFEKIWQDLDHNSSEPIDFIKSLKQEQLQKIFKNSFEPKYLKSIIIGMERFYMQTNKSDILDILENIRLVPRFGMVLMFLDKDIKAGNFSFI